MSSIKQRYNTIDSNDEVHNETYEYCKTKAG